MSKIYFTLSFFFFLFSSPIFSQSVSQVGNSDFPINDNTVSAPVAAINGGWQINGLGKVNRLVTKPGTTTTLYACTASGGFYITTNSGATWSPVGGSFMPGVQFSCLSIDPGNTNVMYAGTGEESYSQKYAWSGLGVFKSLDGGATWSAISTGMGSIVVLDLYLNPANTQQLVAATREGIFRSTNGGTSWSAVVASPASYIAQILPQGAGNLIAIGSTRFYRSTDLGATWTTTDLDPAVSATFFTGRIAVAPTNSNIVYAGWVNNTFANANNASIYYSIDGGVSFTKQYAFSNTPKLLSYDGVSATGYGWANFFFTVSNTDPNTLYTGGHNIYRSTDHGVTWSQVTTNWYCCIHTDIHQLIYDPNNAGRFLAQTDGGVFLSTDGGVNWTTWSKGLLCSQYLSMGQSNLDSNFVIGGLQDNGIIYNNTDGNYHTYTGGDIYDHMTCDYTNTYNVYTTNSGGKVFNPYNRTQVANLNLPAGTFTTGTANNRQSFLISPTTSTLAFAWGSNVFRSNNINSYNLATGTSTISWSAISTFGVPVMDVKQSPVSPNVVYALANNATIYKSSDALAATPAFTPMPLPAGASSNVYGSLTISTLNPNVLYVTANNKVYRSTNGGASWIDYTASGLPVINFQKIFIDPYSSIESVYLLTILGVYYRDLSMNAWIAVNPQAPPQQNASANYQGLIFGGNFFNGTNSATSEVSFSTWGSGIWKSNFYVQLNNALPPSWSNMDIGSPAIAGSAGYDGVKHSFNVKGAGSGINNNNNDQFNFTKVALSGNSDLIAKVYSVAETDATNGLSKTGIMLRTNNNANSPYVMVALTGHAGAVFQYRVNAGDAATVINVEPPISDAFPYWLKINKNASNVLTAFTSPDSLAWTQVGQVTIDLGANFFGGIANTSNNSALINNASVRDVTLTGFNVLAVENIQLFARLKDKNQVDLSWKFNSDDRSDILEVQKSVDGLVYQSILQKKYINNSIGPITFEDRATDAVPHKGNNYYRLKITGQDGAVKYSSVQRLLISNNVFVTLEPNPVKANNEVKIMISGGEALRTIMDLYDFSGKKVFSQTFINNGLNRVEIKELPSGIYFYKIFYDQQVLNGKLVVAN